MTTTTSETTRAPSPSQRLGSLGLGICVLVSGAAVMIFEFLAVRFLQRDFGGSLDVWGSVVAVCLAGLGLGYFAGGALADRYGSARVLGFALVAGGVSGLFMERLALWIGGLLLNVDRGLAWHPHIAALVSSFLPIFALGTVLPVAIRLQTRTLERVGATAGWIAGLSTGGSIAGVLLTTMVLLPNVGVRETLYGTSAALIVLGLILLPFGRRKAAVAALVVALAPAQASAQVLLEGYSSYHHIIVQDVGNERLLRFDNDVQSTMSLRDPYAGGFEYTDFFHAPLVLNPTVRSALFLGLGGGTGPKTFLRYYPQMKVDVAEIDPEVVTIARKYFALPEDPRLTVNVIDGRVALQRSRQKYGAILVDAYASGRYGSYIPYHLATTEFFQLAWQRLEHGGCLVYNYIGVVGGGETQNLHSMRSTLGAVFQALYVFQARTSLNTVFVAVKLDPAVKAQPWPDGPWLQHPLDARQLQSLSRDLMQRGRLPYPGLDERLTQFSRMQSMPFQGRLLTDNYAPLDTAPRRRDRN